MAGTAINAHPQEKAVQLAAAACLAHPGDLLAGQCQCPGHKVFETWWPQARAEGFGLVGST